VQVVDNLSVVKAANSFTTYLFTKKTSYVTLSTYMNPSQTSFKTSLSNIIDIKHQIFPLYKTKIIKIKVCS